MISALDSRVMDANAEALGIGIDFLMGNAGKAIASLIKERFSGKRIAFVCGHGNNGGDGFAAASFLRDEDVRVYLLNPDSIRSDIVRGYLAKAGKAMPFSSCDFEFDVLVDCGLGTGLSGALRPEYSDYVRKANEYAGTVIAVDVPTGFGTDSQIEPDITIAMHDIKEGMTEENCGEIVIADIYMPPDAYNRTGPGDMLRYRIPSPDSHKGASGHLLVIGGGPYYGAPAMASMAALRIGTDLVTVAAPESVFYPIASTNPVLMIKKLSGSHLSPAHIPELLEFSRRCTAVLIGPGLGTDAETQEAVRMFLEECGIPTVIDADGLNSLGKRFRAKVPTVLTPHAKEYERVSDTSTKDEGSVRRAASSMGCTILLKGKEDIVSDGVRCRINGTGCAGMTGAGTGDVLAGIVAGLLAKGLSAFDAACLGAYISGKAGERAFDRLSYGMIATDVIDCIPLVLKDGLETVR